MSEEGIGIVPFCYAEKLVPEILSTMILMNSDEAKKIGNKGNPFPYHITFFIKDLFVNYVYIILPACICASQKRSPDLTTHGCKPSCGC